MKKGKHERNRIFTLNNPYVPRLCPELAQEIGLNESILLLQLEFWISLDSKYHDGNYWTYQSVTDLQEFFPFWSRGTIQNIVKSLESKDLILVGNYNKSRFDRTRWFAINLESTALLKSIAIQPREHITEIKEEKICNETSPMKGQDLLARIGINNPKSKQLIGLCSLQEIEEVVRFAERHPEVGIGWWIWLLENHERCRLPKNIGAERLKNTSFDCKAFFQSTVDKKMGNVDVL